MIGLDTNVLIRLLVQDDPVQLRQAKEVLQALTPKRPGWISIANILEIEWVLRSKYGYSRADVAEIISNLLALPSLVVEQHQAVTHSLAFYRAGKADFGECMISASAHAAGCAKVLTFDRISARDLGMELIRS
jgi:predicted nucleic-acid-binding protein